YRFTILINPRAGFEIFDRRKRKRRKRQHSRPVAARSRSYDGERRSDPERIRVCLPAGNVSKRAARKIEQRRVQAPLRIAIKLIYRDARAVGKIERGAIGKDDADGAAGRRFDYITAINKIARFERYVAGGSCDDNRAARGLDLTYRN